MVAQSGSLGATLGLATLLSWGGGQDDLHGDAGPRFIIRHCLDALERARSGNRRNADRGGEALSALTRADWALPAPLQRPDVSARLRRAAASGRLSWRLLVGPQIPVMHFDALNQRPHHPNRTQTKLVTLKILHLELLRS